MNSAAGFVTSPGLGVPSTLSCTRVHPCRAAPLRLRTTTGRRPARVVSLGPVPAPQQPPTPEDFPEAQDPSFSVPGSPSADVTLSNDSNDNILGEENALGADDILNSPAFLKKKLEVVLKELNETKAAAEAAEEALASEKDSYVRLAADFENYRRRSSQDLRAQEAKSTAKVCREILVVLDNFERAIGAVTPQTDSELSIHESYQAINKQLLDALLKLKVTPVDALGFPFDPEVHEAIQRMESAEYAEGIVCAQFQRGYVIGESLIRPAMVSVSSGPGPDPTVPSAAGDENSGPGEDGDEEDVPVLP